MWTWTLCACVCVCTWSVVVLYFNESNRAELSRKTRKIAFVVVLKGILLFISLFFFLLFRVPSPWNYLRVGVGFMAGAQYNTHTHTLNCRETRERKFLFNTFSSSSSSVRLCCSALLCSRNVFIKTDAHIAKCLSLFFFLAHFLN